MQFWILVLGEYESSVQADQLAGFMRSMEIHLGGDIRSVDTFHNCRKLSETEGECNKIIILCRSTTEMTRECCKTDLLDTSRESHAEFLRCLCFQISENAKISLNNIDNFNTLNLPKLCQHASTTSIS